MAFKKSLSLTPATTPKTVPTEVVDALVRDIKSEVDDIRATLREAENELQKEIDDLSSAARVLAKGIDEASSKVAGLQEELWSKLRNIDNIINSEKAEF